MDPAPALGSMTRHLINSQSQIRINDYTDLIAAKASGILPRVGQGMTCAPFMTSREAVLKDVMLSTALLSPIRVNIVDDIPETETGKLAIFVLRFN